MLVYTNGGFCKLPFFCFFLKPDMERNVKNEMFKNAVAMCGLVVYRFGRIT